MAKRSLLVYRKDRWQHENGMFRNPPTDGSKIGRNSFGTVYRQTLVIILKSCRPAAGRRSVGNHDNQTSVCVFTKCNSFMQHVVESRTSVVLCKCAVIGQCCWAWRQSDVSRSERFHRCWRLLPWVGHRVATCRRSCGHRPVGWCGPTGCCRNCCSSNLGLRLFFCNFSRLACEPFCNDSSKEI